MMYAVDSRLNFRDSMEHGGEKITRQRSGVLLGDSALQRAGDPSTLSLCHVFENRKPSFATDDLIQVEKEIPIWREDDYVKD